MEEARSLVFSSGPRRRVGKWAVIFQCHKGNGTEEVQGRGPCGVTPLLLLYQPRYLIPFSQREKLRPRERKVISPRMQKSNVKCPSLEVANTWDSCFMSLPWCPSLPQEGERGRQGIFLAQMLQDSTGPLLSGRKTTALNRPDSALLSTLNLRVLPDRSGVGRF